MLEAASAGLYCVLGKGVAVAEDLVDAGLASTVEPSAQGIQQGINKALAMPGKNFASRAKKIVEKEFSTQRLATALAGAYSNAVNLQSS